MKLLLLVFLTALAVCRLTDCLRILGVFPLHGKSHWIMAERLVTSLAKRGHQMDVVTHFPLKKTIPNYVDISLEGTMPQVVNNMTASNIKDINPNDMSYLVKIAGSEACKLLALPKMQTLIKNPPKNPPYDLVIVELFLSPCYLAFGRHLNVPMIGMVTSDLHDWLRSMTGNPNNPSFMPSVFSPFGQRMTFWERLMNTLLTNVVSHQVNYYTSNQAEQVKEYFGIDASIDDLYKDVAAILVNSHHTLNGIKPISQGIIEVGGLHVTEDGAPLSPDLQKWLDESKHGCIFFTFGSMVKIESFPKPLLETFYKVFEKLAPVRVLMKVAKKEELLPGLPKNVMTKEWFPQVSVFKHKNTKAFMTHGGLMGTIEAIHFGIPMIGIPLFGDQSSNLKNVASKNLAITLGSVKNVTEETLTNAINAILNDDTYRTNMKRISALFKDRPMSAIDTAIYWVEYVARHGTVLQSPAIHLKWWQVNLLDVYGFIFAGVAIVLYIVIFAVRKLKNQLFKHKSCPKKSKSSELKKNK